MKIVFAFLCLVAAVLTAGQPEEEEEVGGAGAVLAAQVAASRVLREPAKAATLPAQANAKANGVTGKKKSGAGKKKSGAGKKKSGASKKKSSAGKKKSGGGKKKSGASKKKSGAAKKKSGAGKKKSGAAKKKSKSSKKKSKSSKKKSGGSKKKNAGASKKKSKASKKKSSQKKFEGGVRQTNSSSSCGVADVVAAIRKFTLYTTNLNQNRRIRNFVSQSQSKAGKAPTAFQMAYSTLADATGNGTSCNGAPANSTITTIYNRLMNCSATAASICNVRLSTADNATVESCSTSLTNFVTAFQACVASGVCSCFQALPNLTSCTNHSAILAPVTAQKNQCQGSTTAGSFSDCRQQQMASIGFTTACKCPTGMAVLTTQASSQMTTRGASGRNIRSRDIFRFKKLNF